MSKASTAIVSVIIPTLNEADYLDRALLSIGELDQHTECIVVDGGSDDQTPDIARQWQGVKWIAADAPGRGRQMNIGAASAKGDILLFLHADCRLPINAIENVRKACTRHQIAGGSFYLGFTRRHWVLNLCSLLSRINHPLTTYGDQAQFIRRDVFNLVGGFKQSPLMEDLEIQYRLKLHGRLVKIQQPVISSDRRYRRRGPLFHQLFNVLLVILYLAGVSPDQLAKWYRPDMHVV